MCGIVGYVGHRQAAGLLLEGLHRLEYRGYDSAGVAVWCDGEIAVRKKAGRVEHLARLLDEDPVAGTWHRAHAVGHARRTTTSSHPHVGGNGEVVLVHNGVIENYTSLRALQEIGYVFRTATDTGHRPPHRASSAEQIRLGDSEPDSQTCVKAVKLALKKLKGTYGLAVLFRDFPDFLLAARVGSPLVIGVGDGENFLASDAGPLVGYTNEVVYLSDHELVVLRPDGIELLHRDAGPLSPSIHTIDQVSTDVELGDFEHYMLKEIYEQPQSIESALRGRLDDEEATAKFGGLNLDPQQLRRIDRIVLTACGTSWHAGLVGEYLLEEIARIPTEVEYASELRYRNPPMADRTMVFAITQSGNGGTLAALREMKRKGHPTLAICNVVGSTIAQAADGGIYLHAGPDIGVASTKAFTSQ
jgi:glucosamine--fructose-6-phosphate aminotransferase (isomerizing)